jgi:hypothetical protein
MTLTLRRYLLVLLALLQLIAPLVHAHSSNNFSQFGLHLPNFEIYSVAIPENFPALKSFDYLANLDDAIVSISTGMQNQQNNADDLSSLLYFPPTPFIFAVALASCEINFSPQALQSSTTLVHSPQSPRAPPRLYF